ncbi:MAG: glycosyltransferase, partial [Ginsengibacter sp.]
FFKSSQNPTDQLLSIIICHRNKTLLQSLKANIEATIGIPYELLIIDNINNYYTILSAYNEGVRKAKYNIVCFAHEDILFYTSDWGKKAVAHFRDQKVGMIGVIGGMTQSVVPSAWWFNNYFARSARNLLMKDPSKKDKKLYHYYSNPFNEVEKTEVAIIDGLWFCVRKDLFEKISFDEKTFTGFHLYDADISMQVLQHSKNYVVYDILIEHMWSGNISESYYKDLCSFATKWTNYLPVQNNNIESDYMNKYNWHALRSLILEMKAKNISKELIQEIVKKYYPVARQNFKSLWFRNYFLVSEIFGYRYTNSLFYRIEKVVGFCKTPDYIKREYIEIL